MKKYLRRPSLCLCAFCVFVFNTLVPLECRNRDQKSRIAHTAGSRIGPSRIGPDLRSEIPRRLRRLLRAEQSPGDGIDHGEMAIPGAG